jgi:hypothetical protein
MQNAMKNYFSLTLLALAGMFTNQACDKNTDAELTCKSITVNKPFTAKIGEEWCIPATGWSITFGPTIEDSRCNVPEIDCVWAGRFVMAATIDNGEITQDTFFAVNNWRDTLYSGSYTIILDKVKPEIRSSTELLDPSAYSFDMIVR